MIDDKKIRKGAPRHDPVCYRVEQDIMIPAGTMIRARGDGKFSCAVGNYAEFVLEPPQDLAPVGFKKVISA